MTDSLPSIVVDGDTVAAGDSTPAGASASLRAAASCVEPPGGLVSWWTGDGTAADRVGENDGALVGGATFADGFVTSGGGQGFRFFGVDGDAAVRVPGAPSLDPSSATGFTVDAWAASNTTDFNGTVVGKGTPFGGEQYVIDQIGSRWRGFVRLPDGQAVSILGPVVEPGVFTHLALSWDGATLRFHVNGALVGAAGVEAVQTSGTFLGIGARSEAGFSDEDLELEFDGVVDEVEFFDRGLSGSEIAAIAAAGPAGKCKEPELQVSCSPEPIVRGEEITCEASARSGGETPEVRRWFFRGGGHAVEAERTQPTWRGTMAVSGTVSVVGGPETAPDTASTEVTVEPRDWSDRRVEISASEQRPSGLDPAPDTLSDLGQVSLQAETREGFLETAGEGSGPNEGVFYLTDIPIEASATVRVNRAALTEGSAFWRLQPRSAPPGRCDRSDVEPFVPVVLAHEGLPLPAGPKSHIGLFRSALDSVSRDRLEPLTASSRTDLFFDRVKTVFENEIWPAADRAQARADDPANAPSYCQFRFFDE